MIEPANYPKAYIVKANPLSMSVSLKNKNDEELKQDIAKYVEEKKARYKRLRGGVQFTNQIPKSPKSPSGKILRRVFENPSKAGRPEGRYEIVMEGECNRPLCIYFRPINVYAVSTSLRALVT
jgi:hypothetical protein